MMKTTKGIILEVVDRKGVLSYARANIVGNIVFFLKYLIWLK